MFLSAMSLTASNTDAEGVIVWTAGSDFDLSISLTVFTFGYAAIVVPEDAVRVHCGRKCGGNNGPFFGGLLFFRDRLGTFHPAL